MENILNSYHVTFSSHRVLNMPKAIWKTFTNRGRSVNELNQWTCSTLYSWEETPIGSMFSKDWNTRFGGGALEDQGLEKGGQAYSCPTSKVAIFAKCNRSLQTPPRSWAPLYACMWVKPWAKLIKGVFDHLSYEFMTLLLSIMPEDYSSHLSPFTHFLLQEISLSNYYDQTSLGLSRLETIWSRFQEATTVTLGEMLGEFWFLAEVFV